MESRSLEQLQQSSRVSFRIECSCFGSRYQVLTPDGTVIFSLKGVYKIKIRDPQKKELGLLDVDTPLIWGLTSIAVSIGGLSPLTVRYKRAFSSSIMVMEAGEQFVMKIKKKGIFSNDYEITDCQTGGQIGMISSSFMEYEISYPQSLSIRYKAALIAVVKYIIMMRSRRNN